MTTTTYNTYRNTSFFTIASAVLLIAALPATAGADGWELRTTEIEVSGTREIESGRIEKGMRLSRVQLESASSQKKAAALTNLCIGSIATRDFESAENYCNGAVKTQREQQVTYNNRGILKALQGDFAGAMADFERAGQAGCFGECNQSDNVRDDLPRTVAKRNHGRAVYQAQLREQQERMAGTTE